MKQVDRSKLILAGATALFLTAAACNTAIARSPPTMPAAKPSQFKNLKVFRADIPRDELLGVMRRLTVALGVKCAYCHVNEAGMPGLTDFASDAKKAKLTARMMMLMTARINQQDLGLKTFPEWKVSCFTCHRGAVKPLIAPPPVLAPTAS